MFTKTLSAALILASLGLGTAAIAQPNQGLERDQGVIADIDAEENTVTLANGATYTLPAGFALGVFNEGQRVSINFDMVGSTPLATSMSIGG